MARRAGREDGRRRSLSAQAVEHDLPSKDELKRRAEEAGEYVDVDQLCLSGQCGFSSTVEGNALSHDKQWAKLALIVETAREVWG
jgi:5-methyltetrahydropteroyltriglutamate--homocysteine methyltransferase